MSEVANRLVKAAADAISAEECRFLGGHGPTGGHAYFAPGAVAAAAVLRELAKGGTRALWVGRFGTSMIQARDLRALANEIEGDK